MVNDNTRIFLNSFKIMSTIILDFQYLVFRTKNTNILLYLYSIQLYGGGDICIYRYYIDIPHFTKIPFRVMYLKIFSCRTHWVKMLTLKSLSEYVSTVLSKHIFIV